MTDPVWLPILIPAAAATLLAVGRAVVAFVKWTAGLVATQVVDSIGDTLQSRWRADIEEAVAPIRDEVQVNGGGGLKDRVLDIQRQLETLITDR